MFLLKLIRQSLSIVLKRPNEFFVNENLKSPCFSRYLNYVTKSHLFKNLNLKIKADCNLQTPKIIFKSSKLTGQKSLSNGHLLKIEIHIFDRATLSGLATWEFTVEEDSDSRKQALSLNL